jgi:hypothetical protein
MAAVKLQHTRDGRMLCTRHASSGAPAFHTEGCDECAKARAKGIIRPNIEDTPPKQRGRASQREKWIEWSKIKPENRAALAGAVVSRKHG